MSIDGKPVACFSSEDVAHPTKQVVRLAVPRQTWVDDVKVFASEPTTGKWKGLWSGAGFNYVGPQAMDARNKSLFAPDYTLWNASLGYDWKWSKTKMKALLNLQNISDEDYQPSIATIGMPRRAVLSLTTEF